MGLWGSSDLQCKAQQVAIGARAGVAAAGPAALGRIPEETNWPAGTGNQKTQMPVLPWTLRTLFERLGGNDTALLYRFVPPLVRYWQWWRDTRVLDERGLVTVLHPWESGIDVSPAFDAA